VIRPQEKQLAKGAILHTTMGDIQVVFYGEECPRTVENFTVHSKNGYYNNLIFHRVIKGFMIQGGDPKGLSCSSFSVCNFLCPFFSGDGTGGTSIWGSEFEDEIRPALKHDKPFTLSMANAGPNTNGSQFFITTVPTPWLDGKHTVFGRVTKGTDVVQSIERVKVNSNSKPYEDIRIMSITVI
jgi:peptidylprolyl isomerase domain and WD repeat-containing protein 1